MREAILELARWIRPVELFGADDGDGEDKGEEGTPQAGADGDGDGDGEKKKEEAKTYDEDYVAKLRKENAERRVTSKAKDDELEAAKSKLKELEQKEMGELEKAKADLEEAQKAARDAEAKATKAQADVATLKISTAVTLEAIQADFQDPQDVLGMISQDDLVDEEGQIDNKAIKKRLKSLSEKKPYLLKPKGSGSGDGGPTGTLGDKGTDEEKIDAHHQKFLAGGRVARTG